MTNDEMINVPEDSLGQTSTLSQARAGIEQGREPPATAADALVAVAELNRLVASDGARLFQRWRGAIRRFEFLPSAANLAHYLALRRHDLTDLQDILSPLGLSSLGRCEGRVLATLAAVLASVSRLAGAPPSPYPPLRQFRTGEQLLLRRTKAIFGADPTGPRSRIMVTFPSDAATDRRLVSDLLAAGADCARINCAHDEPETWSGMIDNLRAAAADLKRDCRVLMDLGGPKVRTLRLLGERADRLNRGSFFSLQGEAGPGPWPELPRATISHPEILDQLRTGAKVWFDDGRLGARIEDVQGRHLRLRVFSVREKGLRLKPEKGLNFPDTVVDLPPLTGKDLVDLDFVAAHADMVGYSFVQKPEDIVLLQTELAKRRPGLPLLPLVIKIETRLAVKNLPQLIVQAAGRQPLAIMVARGDLAVELGFGRLSEMQEQILWLCEAAQVPVIWATQVLQNLIKDGAPSRAETTDAAMAQRAECVMLNKGPFLVEGVRLLDDVLRRMDRHQAKKSARLAPLKSWADLDELALAGAAEGSFAP
jgi:pyruvate kinase